MADTPITFVLIHGSWHDGGCWRHVQTHLQAQGHTAFAPTLPGRGPGASLAITFQDLADAVSGFVLERGLEGVALVGHSGGGPIVRKAAEKLGGRLSRLVYLSPLLSSNGQTVLDSVPPAYGDLFRQMAAASADNTVTAPWEVFRDGFIGDADLATAKAAYAELHPEPFAPFLEPVNLDVFAGMQIPTSYINPTEDTVFPLGEWSFFPRMAQLSGASRIVQMPGSHEVMYSDPKGLAEALIKAARP
jgi:pimeloyl-ACP methyl ester carboxylesterase